MQDTLSYIFSIYVKSEMLKIVFRVVFRVDLEMLSCILKQSLKDRL